MSRPPLRLPGSTVVIAEPIAGPEPPIRWESHGELIGGGPVSSVVRRPKAVIATGAHQVTVNEWLA